MITNTDIEQHSEANALVLSRPHLCDLPAPFRNNAPASSTAGPRRTTRSVQNCPKNIMAAYLGLAQALHPLKVLKAESVQRHRKHDELSIMPVRCMQLGEGGDLHLLPLRSLCHHRHRVCCDVLVQDIGAWPPFWFMQYESPCSLSSVLKTCTHAVSLLLSAVEVLQNG